MKLQISRSFEAPLHDQARYLLLQGGRGSGKSYFAIQKVIYRCLVERGHRILIVRKTQPSLRRSVWTLTKHILNTLGIPYYENKTELTISFLGNELLFSGLDDPDKVKSIQGVTSIFIEEALELTKQDFTALDAILRGKTAHYKQILLAYNPDRKTSFIYKDFVEKKRDGATLHISTVTDNPYIDKEYIKILEEIKDPELRRSWLEGDWANLGDLIFTHYKIQDFELDEVLDKATAFYGGGDFGFTAPSTFLLCADVDGAVYVLDEICQTKLKTSQLAGETQELIKRAGIPERDLVGAWFDSAEPDRILEIESIVYYPVYPSKKGRDGSIMNLREHDLIIHPQCVNLCKEIGSWSWAKDRDGNTLDKPVKGADHSIDALLYATFGYYTDERAARPSITII